MRYKRPPERPADETVVAKRNDVPRPSVQGGPSKLFLKVFPAGHFVISALFVVSAFALLAFAGFELWEAIVPSAGRGGAKRVDGVLNSIALLTIAVAALELGQTIFEEEIQREAHMSAPSRVRRFLSRFLVVLVVALSIEALVAAFRFSREDPSSLPYAAAIGLMAAALLAAWGVFIKLNHDAELLEPEALQAAKQEDSKVDNAK